MPSSNSSAEANHYSYDLLPFRCPTCGNGKRFRSLIALRLHLSIVHDADNAHSIGNYSINNLNNSGADKSSSLDVYLDKASENNDNVSLDFPNLLADTAVDDMFNKYSAKIDEVEFKFDNRSQKLENKVKLSKQLEEIRKQKEQLEKIKTAWQAAHGVSQLVRDTDLIINKSLNYEKTGIKSKLPPQEITSVKKKVAKSQTDVSYQATMDKQLDISIHLAAQYKALALDTEKKLNEKLEEERHFKMYLEETARKEQEAKKKLAEFIESLLQRTEYAESKLKSYQNHANNLDQTKQTLTVKPKRNARQTFSFVNEKNLKEHQEKILATDTSRSLSRLNDPSKSQNTRFKETYNDEQMENDSYVNEILERPSSSEFGRKPQNQKQLNLSTTSNLNDTSQLFPFSNNLTENKNSTHAADRRVALFCVFTQLRSVDLLRCSLVCREWKETSRHSQLWSRIKFHDVNVDPKLFNLISNWSNETCFICLKNIGLLLNDQSSCAGILEESLELILKFCSEKLLVLSIDQCDPFITSRILWLVSCYNRNICSVSYRSSLDPVSHQVAWALGSSCRNIVSLEIAPLQPCSARGLFTNNVARLLSWCWPRLQALSFGGLDIDGAGLLAVALNCHHLKVLELDHARGVSHDQALIVCKHGLKELHTLLFTHTPILPTTLLHFLKSLNLKSVYVIVSRRDYFTRNKFTKIDAEYAKISRALLNIGKSEAYRDIVAVECQ